MNEEVHRITFNKIMQSEHYTVFLLGTDKKHFSVYTEAKIGEHLQSFLAHERPARPNTHNLLKSIFESLGIKPLHVLLHDVQENIYFSRLFLEQEMGEKTQILEIDARPSDALTIALMYEVPIFCTGALLDKAPGID